MLDYRILHKTTFGEPLGVPTHKSQTITAEPVQDATKNYCRKSSVPPFWTVIINDVNHHLYM